MKQNPVSRRVQTAALQEMVCSTGLSEDQVIKSRQQYGSNALTGRNQRSFLKCLSRAFVNPFSTILFVLALISFMTERLSGDTGSLRSVVVILTMLLIVILMNVIFWNQKPQLP